METELKLALCREMTTAWSWVLPQKLTGSQLIKKFPAFYGTRRFITAFASVRHTSVSWAKSIQSIPLSTSWRFILILSSRLLLGLQSGFIPSGFPTKTLLEPLISLILATCPAHLIFLDLVTRIMFCEEYRSLIMVKKPIFFILQKRTLICCRIFFIGILP